GSESAGSAGPVPALACASRIRSAAKTGATGMGATCGASRMRSAPNAPELAKRPSRMQTCRTYRMEKPPSPRTTTDDSRSRGSPRDPDAVAAPVCAPVCGTGLGSAADRLYSWQPRGPGEHDVAGSVGVRARLLGLPAGIRRRGALPAAVALPSRLVPAPGTPCHRSRATALQRHLHYQRDSIYRNDAGLVRRDRGRAHRPRGRRLARPLPHCGILQLLASKHLPDVVPRRPLRGWLHRRVGGSMAVEILHGLLNPSRLRLCS